MEIVVENLFSPEKFVVSIGEFLVSIGENQQFLKGFISDVYLTVDRGYFYFLMYTGSTERIESPTKLL